MRTSPFIGLFTILSASVLATTAQAQLFDHQKCYKIRDAGNFTASASLQALQSTYGVENCTIKGKAKFYCVAVAKTVSQFQDQSGGVSQQQSFPGDALNYDRICYKITCPRPTIAPQLVTDQFGSRNVDNFKPQLLCTPAAPGPLPTTTTTSTTTTSTTTVTVTTTTTTLPQKFVFVTMNGYTGGEISKPVGANQKCQTAATNAGLPGTYKAWIAAAHNSTWPVAHFTHATVPYVRTDGAVVANNWTDLTDGTLQNPINTNEFGNVPTSGVLRVWTNVIPDGRGHSDHCNDWTSSANTVSGLRGLRDQVNSTWTQSATSTCNLVGKLYCFQQ